MIDLGKYGKHTQAIIIFIYDNNEIPITRLSELVKNSQTYSRTVHLLEEDGIIKSREFIHNRLYRMISLTDKGKALAESLKRTEQVLSSDSSSLHILPPHYEDQFKNLSALTHLNVLDDHIAIRDLNFDGAGHDRVAFVYVKLNGNNIMRLWCEADNTYECVHTKYAWSLPDVQAMVQNQVLKRNIKKADSNGN